MLVCVEPQCWSGAGLCSACQGAGLWESHSTCQVLVGVGVRSTCEVLVGVGARSTCQV